jgi:hypothetical protein
VIEETEAIAATEENAANAANGGIDFDAVNRLSRNGRFKGTGIGPLFLFR